MALQTKTFSVSKNTFTLRLTVTENSTSTSGNSSSVSYKLELISTTKDFSQFGVGASVSLDGRVVATRDRYTASKISLGTYSSVTLLSGSTTIGHDNQGDKTLSVSYSIDMAAASYTPGPMSGSGSMPLTKIPRGATIASAPNFNDEENPVVRVNNPAGVKVQLGIFKDSTHAIADYRVISGTSYTFNLTNAERNLLRQVSTTSNTAQVRFYVKSTVGGQQFIFFTTRTLTIKNPAPTLAPTVEDVNPLTVALTGDPSVMVRYASKAQVITGAKAVKFATLKSVKVTCGSKSISGDGTISGVEFGSFQISATDSRGNTTTATVKKTLVEYVTPTCYIGEGTPNAVGEYDFSTSGTAWNGDFGEEVNLLTAEYRYRLQGGDWGEWLPMEVQTNGNSYTATVHVEGLDYTAMYEFQGRVSDRLNTAESTTKMVTSIPVFDFGKNDFNFNVPVFLSKYLEDGTKEVHGLARCGMTARISSTVSMTGGEKEIPIGAILQEFGGCELSGGGIQVANDGIYEVSASVYFSQMVDPMYVGLYVRAGIEEVVSSHTGIAGGVGAVVSPTSVVALSAGDVVSLYAYTPPGLTAAVSNDPRTRLTVAQIF